MQRLIRLGQTSMEIFPLGLGGIPLQRMSQEEATELIGACLDAGMNFIDTARGYTISEEYIGNALKELGDPEVILATKSMKRDPEGFKEEMELSFKLLQRDFIDLYQFHNLRSLEEFETLLSDGGAYSYAKEMLEKGRIGAIGLTTHRVDVLEKALESGLFATLQFPMNYMERHGEKLLKEAKEKGIGIIIMKPFAGGALKHKGLALRFLLHSGACDVVIPGMDSVEQLFMNLEEAKKGPLTGREYALLKEEAEELGEHFCRRCGYCLPCAVGIDIPSVFLMEGYYSRYNLQEWAKERYDAFSKKASDCIQCGLCESRCPYELPIIGMLENVRAVLEK